MGKGGGGGSSQPANTSNTTYLDPAIQRIANENYDFAKNVAAIPYQPYYGDRIANFTNTELQGMNATRNAATSGLGYQNLNNAVTAATGVAGYNPVNVQAGNTLDGFGAYLDAAAPMFQGAVIDQSMADIDRMRRMSLNAGAANAAQQGAFGGSRHGVADAETNRAALDQLGRTSADLRMQGWNTALGAYTGDLNRSMQAQMANQNAGLAGANMSLTAANQLASLAAMQRQFGYSDAQALQQLGAQERGMNQLNLDLAYSDFQNQRDYPLQQLSILQSALSQTPYGSTVSGTGTAARNSGSPLAGAIGGGLAGYGLGSSIGAIGGPLGAVGGALLGGLLG